MIEEILKKSIGLNVECISRKKFESDIILRMMACGISDRKKYADLLRKSPAELKMLIESVTIPETWFFRIENSFVCLEQYLSGKLMSTLDSKKVVRVLSMPCSTGEEPYSIAMAFYECGYTNTYFHIDAVDVSEVCLAKAARGVYSPNSFRGVSQRLKNRFFKQDGRFLALNDKIKRSVVFSRCNALEMEPPESGSNYDIIFCRNLLIYLDNKSQKKVIDYIYSSLKDDGLLFTGHSEAGLFFDSPFTTYKTDGSFSFKKNLESTEGKRRFKPGTETTASKTDMPFTRLPESQKASTRKHLRRKYKEVPKEKTDRKAVDKLKEAEYLANTGKLKKAQVICQEYLRKNKLDPKAYCLMGMIMLSEKNYSEAEKFFNKALFIYPDYYEALLSVALIHEQSGNLKMAENFRRRAESIN